MSKRMIETSFFDDKFVMQLSKDAKLLYIYFFVKCDHAGLIEPNFQLIEFVTGIKSVEQCLKELEGKVVKLSEDLYFLPKFFKRQYPNYPDKAFKAATSAHEKLKSLGLWDETNSKVTLSKQLKEPPNQLPPPTEPEDPPPPEDKIKHVMEAVDTWNFFANHYKLPKVMKLTEARKSHIKQRLAEDEFNLEQILRKVEKSDFLLGKKTEWNVDFDFIFSSKNNYIKILEGKYDGRNKQSNHQDELNEILLDIASDPNLKSRSD